MTCDKVK